MACKILGFTRNFHYLVSINSRFYPEYSVRGFTRNFAQNIANFLPYCPFNKNKNKSQNIGTKLKSDLAKNNNKIILSA